MPRSVLVFSRLYMACTGRHQLAMHGVGVSGTSRPLLGLTITWTGLGMKPHQPFLHRHCMRQPCHLSTNTSLCRDVRKAGACTAQPFLHIIIRCMASINATADALCTHPYATPNLSVSSPSTQPGAGAKRREHCHVASTDTVQLIE